MMKEMEEGGVGAVKEVDHQPKGRGTDKQSGQHLYPFDKRDS